MLAPAMSKTLYTIGHSTRPLQELVGMLTSNGVTTLVDVRTVPKSRTNPQARSSVNNYMHDEHREQGLACMQLKAFSGNTWPQNGDWQVPCCTSLWLSGTDT